MSTIGRANADWLYLPTTEPRVPSAFEEQAAAWSQPFGKPDRIPEPPESPRRRQARAFQKRRAKPRGSTEAFVAGVDRVLAIRRSFLGED